MLPPEEAAVVEQSKPQRLPPFVLSPPHEAIPVLHKDWTLVGCSVGPRQVRSGIKAAGIEEQDDT
eukprot:4535811-Pyramimonas_sp.AAC.1